MSERPPNRHGHPPRRASATARVSGILKSTLGRIAHHRAQTAQRFGQPSAWVRLVALGILLIDLAVLTFAATFLDQRLEGYWPGMAPIFGGLLLAIIVIRVGRPILYLDWIASGALEVTLGVLLTRNPHLPSMSSFLPFLFCFVGLGLLRIWIGLTVRFGKGSAWLTAGGLTSLFCAGWMAVDRLTATIVPPDVVLAADLLLTGVSIGGFGLSLRKPS